MSTRRAADTFDVPIGSPVLYGKYKNKKGKVIGFKRDEKGNPIVVVEPVPKGRKHNKEIQLFRIWPADRATATEEGAWRAAGVSMKNVKRFAHTVTGLSGGQMDAWEQAARDWWNSAPRASREKMLAAARFDIPSNADMPSHFSPSWDSLSTSLQSALTQQLRKRGAIMVTPEEADAAPALDEGAE